eukprot:1289769-Amphidinium_carterae.1
MNLKKLESLDKHFAVDMALLKSITGTEGADILKQRWMASCVPGLTLPSRRPIWIMSTYLPHSSHPDETWHRALAEVRAVWSRAPPLFVVAGDMQVQLQPDDMTVGQHVHKQAHQQRALDLRDMILELGTVFGLIVRCSTIFKRKEEVLRV